MPHHRRHNQAITVIDHEPLVNSNNNQQSNEQKPVFGKRKTSGPKPAVTKDFFSPRANTEYKADPFYDRQKNTESNGFQVSNVLAALPLKSLAAVLAIAIGLPMAFITISERRSSTNIDPVTTASISTINGLEISDVSLTRVLRQDNSVATVFGRISNPQNADKSLRPLIITLYDNEGNEVQSWQHRIGKAEIQANQNYRFMTSAIDYSGKGRTVRVTIAN